MDNELWCIKKLSLHLKEVSQQEFKLNYKQIAGRVVSPCSGSLRQIFRKVQEQALISMCKRNAVTEVKD